MEVVKILLLGLGVGLASALFLTIFFNNHVLSFLTISTILIITISITTKHTVDWFFHFYIITNHKILEISCSPLFSYAVTDVLLNQVKCTEIDFRRNGFVNELIDMGDVVITFDRPTHQEEIILRDIKNPRETALFLSNALDSLKNDSVSEIWYKPKNKKKSIKFIEEILPEGQIKRI